MKTTFHQAGLLAGSVLIATSLVACGGGGGGSGGTTPTATAGTLSVALTDAPACGFSAVNVTVNKVRVNTSATASDTDAGWTDITLSPARKINLLDLSNGVLTDLGQTTLPAGHYSQLRLVLDPNTGNGMANSVVPTGGTETTLTTPSAIQSGIKLVNEFDVAAGQHVDLALDFNACKSVVTQGNGKYLLKPVVKVVPVAQVGISGVIATSLLGSNVTVSAEQNGQVIASTVPNPATDAKPGEFFLSHLPSGNYDVVITADNHAAAVIATVPVASTGSTVVSSTSAPIDLPASAMASIAGTVTLPANATEAAYVSAKQAFTAGPTVTIKYAGADLSTGAYTIANLPVATPMYATYSGATVPLTFTAAPTVVPGAGKYQVDASGTGYTTKSISLVDVSTANATGVNFTLTP
ncbi:DUF4382 domain-containing protein [Massilia sp. TW-1]|uniref:DUF4382 domain-containing protein n=1 Tax=Telluria antibiotica TaxID=2717319 RepID=A0ABX0PDF4_9BURK|nr:DUF4382 domain-containing protein [Telluria antibiotica]NIA55276.1 DUF4382 domain-containing protein [Telluria antibiotica]